MRGAVDDRNQETELLYRPVAEVRTYQLTRLRQSVESARRSAFYGPRLAEVQVEALSDLGRLALTTKEEARAASPDGLLAVPEEELIGYHESYGTTGPPTSSWMTRGDMANYAAQINQVSANLRANDRVLVRFPYAISVPAHIVTQAARNRGACVIPASSRTEITPYPRVLDLLRKLRVTVLACLPTEAIWLAETARLTGASSAHDFPHLRAILVAGELLTPARKRRIAELWNTRVYNLYGCTEAGNIAADCPQGRLHLSWDHFLLECLDEQTWKPVSPGEVGIGVLTTLTREAQPMLRFVLGDWLRVQEGCPCGRTAPVLEHLGRDLNRFEWGGRMYFVRDLEERLLAAPTTAIGNVWLVEVRPNGVRFRVEAEQADPRLYLRLQEQVAAEVGLTLEIDPVPVGALWRRERLTQVVPVGKPRTIVRRQEGEAKATLDEV